MFMFSLYIKNKKNLFQFSGVLSKLSFSGCMINNVGNVGIGKTSFIKSFIGKYINYKYDVKSPTYSLVETYVFSNIFFHHFDLYRLLSPNELFDIDLNNYLINNSILFFEWGDKLVNKFFFAHIHIFFFYTPTR